MMYDFKQKVKDSINLLELVKEYCEVKPVGNNIWSAHCPHPDHNDKTASFRIWYNKDTKSWFWACMGCHSGKKNLNDRYCKNYGTDCFAFIQWMSDYKGSKHIITFPEAIKILAHKANIPIPTSYNKNLVIFQTLNNISKCYQDNLTLKIKEYLKFRGLDDVDIQKWRIGATYNYFGYRITFPLFNRSNQVIGFSNRLFLEEENSKYPKYYNSKNSKIFNKSSYFYGEHLITDDCNEIRITEGVFDVILANKYNVPNIVATLGTAFTEEHIEKIKEYKKIPVFIFDSDKAGQKATSRAIQLLAQSGIYSKICILPKGYDLADLANKEKDKLEEYIQKYSILYWQYMLKDTSLSFESKVNELRMKVLPEILQVKDSVQTPQEKIIFNNFILERFGIVI